MKAAPPHLTATTAKAASGVAGVIFRLKRRGSRSNRVSETRSPSALKRERGPERKTAVVSGVK
jgi:hypothetical protein